MPEPIKKFLANNSSFLHLEEHIHKAISNNSSSASLQREGRKKSSTYQVLRTVLGEDLVYLVAEEEEEVPVPLGYLCHLMTVQFLSTMERKKVNYVDYLLTACECWRMEMGSSYQTLTHTQPHINK